MFLRRSMVNKCAGVSGRVSPLLLSAAVALTLGDAARAATQSSTWVGGTSANWSTPANWSPNTSYPNNGNGGFSDYNVTINAVTNPNLSPTLDVAATIDSLTLNTGAALSINSAISLTLTGSTLSNSGTLTLTGNGTLGSASLFFNNAATSLTGGGTILFTDGTYSRIQSGNLTNVDNTLQGAGYISATVINQSLIRAQGGTLTLGAAVDNTAGNISVTSTGNLSVGSTLTGGNISVATGGLLTGSGSLHNVTLTAGTDWKIQAAANSPTISQTLTNNGSITLLGDGSLGVAGLLIDSTNGATLTGNGTVNMTDSIYSRITGGNLTNLSTIQGAGFFTASITNNGSIIAQNGNLTVAANLNNAGGNITVAATGNLVLSATLTGGNITLISGSALSGGGGISGASLSGTAAVTGSVQFTNDSLASGGNITIHSAASPQLFGNFTNHGAITLLGDSTFGVAALVAPFTGSATLNGGGIITLTDPIYSRITGGNLTNLDNTIQGAGFFTATITNQGSIIAQNGNLTVAAPLNNTGGNISIGSTGNLIVSAPISGGNITFISGGNISGSGNITLATLTGAGSVSGPVGLTNDTVGSGGNISIFAGATLPIVGSLNNQGNITVFGNSTFGLAGLSIDTGGNVTLSGGGSITLSDPIYSRITGGNLTNLDNTIQGTGSISASLTNHGSVIAQNGNLSIAANLTNTGGNITVASTGNLVLNANLTGGNITLISGSTISGSGNISLATFSGSGSISGPVGLTNDTVGSGGNISVSASLPITGTLTNQGSITLHGNSTIGPAALAINSINGVTLSGGGTIILTDPTYSRITTGNLTNTDNTIRGAGMISVALTSQGALIAENGTLALSGNYSGGGSVTIASTGTLTAGNFTAPLVTNNGQFTMSGNGTINSIVGTGALTAANSHLVIPQSSPNILQSDLTVTGSKALDITNNKVILESTPSAKAVTIPRLHSESNNGFLTSSTAAAINTTDGKTDQVVAVVDNAIRLSVFGPTASNFGGTNNVDANSILITATWLGDANLDGVVDLKDLQALATHWQQPVTDWSQADFDGNGIVALPDLQALATHWQAGVGAGSSQSFSDALALLPVFNTTSPVPEPLSLVMLGFAAPFLLIHRRRCR